MTGLRSYYYLNGLNPCSLILFQLSAIDLFIYQCKFSASLSTERTVFLCPAHQVGNHILNRAEGQVFTYRTSCLGEVKGDMVTHPIELGKVNMGMVQRQTLFLSAIPLHAGCCNHYAKPQWMQYSRYDLCKKPPRHYSHGRLLPYPVVWAKTYCFSSALRPLFFHISSPDQLNSEYKILQDSRFQHVFQK